MIGGLRAVRYNEEKNNMTGGDERIQKKTGELIGERGVKTHKEGEDERNCIKWRQGRRTIED